jgi:hypothetical protein
MSYFKFCTKIRKTVTPSEWLGQQDINKEIQTRKYGWIGHTLRKKNVRENVNAGTEKQVYYTSLGGICKGNNVQVLQKQLGVE